MATSPVSLVSNTATALTDKVAASSQRLADSEQTFLKLLTTQLKNQDPLSPLDSNQFTQQIVQMTGVEQQLYSNQLLQTLVSQGGGALTGGVGLIGKSVTMTGDTTTLASGQGNYSYDLASTASSVDLEVVDSAGRMVWQGTNSSGAAGRHNFIWDGKNASGQQLADGGQYRLIVNAKDANGAPVGATQYVTGIATALETVDGQNLITIGKTRVPLSGLVGVTAS